jgi:hypothetical protein
VLDQAKAAAIEHAKKEANRTRQNPRQEQKQQQQQLNQPIACPERDQGTCR